jgi:hypothetical protein
LAAGPALGQGAVPPGTYRAQAGGDVLQVRIGADGTVELAAPDGRKAAGRTLFSNARGITALVGGETVSIGPTSSGLQMALGGKLYRLEVEKEPPKAEARKTTPVAGSLGGLSLSSAQGVSGHRTLTTFDFCSNGTFFRRVEELQSSQFGNASGVRNDNGTWALAGATLELRYARAGAASHALQRVADGVVALDSRRYAVERSTRCP